LITNHFPQSFKEIIILVLRKSNKPNYTKYQGQGPTVADCWGSCLIE
jgi:hypothetical protein